MRIEYWIWIGCLNPQMMTGAYFQMTVGQRIAVQHPPGEIKATLPLCWIVMQVNLTMLDLWKQ